MLGRGERAGTPPCQEHRFAMRGSPWRRGAPTFHYGRILPRGPGCAGSRLLQELGSDPQPTGALGRGVGLGTRRAVGRAGSGGHSRDRAPWMGPHQPPHKARCLPACPGSCPGPMGAHGALPALWCSPHRAAPPCWGATGVSPTPVPGEFRALLTPCWELASIRPFLHPKPSLVLLSAHCSLGRPGVGRVPHSCPAAPGSIPHFPVVV